MILYNVTVNVDHSIHDEWLEWMKYEHIPEVLATGLFIDNRFYKIITDGQESENTYSIQYFLRSMDDYEKYQNEHSAEMQAKHSEKYQGKFIAFRTVMELVK